MKTKIVNTDAVVTKKRKSRSLGSLNEKGTKVKPT